MNRWGWEREEGAPDRKAGSDSTPPPGSSAGPLVKKGQFALICMNQLGWEREDAAPDLEEEDQAVHHHL
jgi:hypothetical protein